MTARPEVIDAVPGVPRRRPADPVVPALSSQAGVQALLRGQAAVLDAVHVAATPSGDSALAVLRAKDDVVAAALDWFGSQPGVYEERAIASLDSACARLVELRGGIR
ncbi:hypothetical protein ACQP60_04335 [Isoptericola variabilis]|uniref:hypothetical protein n=1 Tax=Isoptericola variabilis TaxID=139208 RepID=UPI003D1F16D4